MNPPLGPPLSKTTGALPVIFTGERDKAEAFLEALKGYLRLNERVPPLDTWRGKTALTLTLIQGEAVEDFVREQGDAYDSDPRELRALWSNFLQAFEHRFLDTQRDAKARESIEKLTLEDGNIDLYIQKFKSLARKAQYDLQEHSVIRIFLQGLPFRITKEVIGAPKPRTFGEHTVKAIEAVNADNSLKVMYRGKDSS
jgi:hypothetical protein